MHDYKWAQLKIRIKRIKSRGVHVTQSYIICEGRVKIRLEAVKKLRNRSQHYASEPPLRKHNPLCALARINI